MKFVPKGLINNIPALVQIMAWRRPGDKPLSEPMEVSLLTHICITRPQWVNWTFRNKFQLKLSRNSKWPWKQNQFGYAAKLYRPPSANDSYFNDILDMIEKATVNGQDCILLGDLNYDYDINESLHKNPIHYIESLYEMTQLITEKTRVTECSETLLDVILTTNPKLHRVSGVVKKTLSDHYMIYTELTFPKKLINTTHNVITYRNFKDFKEDGFINDIKNNEVLTKSEGYVSWNEWKNQFLLISDVHAPIKTARMKSRSNPWITRAVINHMYERDKIHERATRNGDPVLMVHYRKLRNNVTEMIKQNKKKYFQNVNNTSRSNPRKFWSELTSVIPKINERSIPRTMTANDFNIFFTSVPDKLSTMCDKGKPLLWNSAQSIHTFKFHEISRNDVLKFLKSLPEKSGMDIHGFDRKLLKLSSEHVVDSLSCIINSSLNSGRVFDDWKVARVTPVYKNSGDMHVMSNYRPISVIGHIAKIVEQLIRTQLVDYLDEHSFITPDQFAYLKGHSTQTCLHRVIDDWLENVNEGQITGMCMLDIAKCFDTIDHDLLLKKLSLYGIKNVEFEWFKSYLHQRKQAVLCNGQLSSFVDISSGVPQGSVLGPFLFLLFINDISNFAANGCLINLFADDTIIYTSGDSI